MRKYLLVCLFIILQAAVFYAALSELTPSNKSIFSGSVMHFIAFFLTTLVIGLVLHEFSVKHPFVYGFAYSIIAAVLIEFLQKNMTSSRSAELGDIVIGVIGAAVMALVGELGLFYRN